MKALDRFLFKGFLHNFLVILVVLFGIITISEAFVHTDKLEEEGFTFLVLVEYLALRAPATLVRVAPFSVLLATLVYLGDLAKNAELTALRAGGVSFARIARPLLVGGVLVGVAVFGLNERVVGPLDQFAQNLLHERTATPPSGRWMPEGGVWFRDGRFVVSATQVARSGRELRGVNLFRVDAEGLLVEVLSSESLVFREGAWHLAGAAQVSLSDLAISQLPKQELALRARPEMLADLGRSPEGMGLVRLWGYVENLQRQGRPTDALAFTLWQKITLPLSCAVMVLVAAPFVSLTPRSGGRVGRLLAGIGVGMAFHFSNVLAEQLTVAGGLPPMWAAWLPVLLFTALGGLLFWRMR